MARNRAHRSLNMQTQLHEAVDVVMAEPREQVMAKPKEAIDRESLRVYHANGAATLVPMPLPDPIFGYPSTDE